MRRPCSTACWPTSRPRATGSGLVVAGLDEAGWRTPTPAEGWDVATQVAHLAWTDEVAVLGGHRQGGLGRARAAGARRPRRLRRRPRPPRSRGCTPPGAAGPLAARPAAALRRGAPRPTRTGSGCRGSARRCRPTSMATARFMETWAHGLDVTPALGVEPEAATGSGTSPTSACAPATSRSPRNGLSRAGRGVPGRLTAPSGETWAWGPQDAAQTGDRARRTTSACSSPSASTATTPTSPPTGAGRRPLARHRPVLRRPAGRGAASRGERDPAPGRQLLGLLRRPALARCARCSRAAPLDVLTGDYLAELTMLILGRDQLKDPSLGYARTFVRQVEDCLGLALRAGRADRQQRRRPQPRRAGRRGCARSRRGLGPRPGDRVRRGRRPARRSRPSSGSATGADRQRLPRRLRHRRRAGRAAPTSSSPAGSPTPRSSSGRRSPTSAGRATSYDELAGAVVAGHVIECGTQATGGNFSGFRDLSDRDAAAGLPGRRDRRRRLVRHHQARRHRRRGHRRHRHRPAGLRDPVDALPRPRRHHPPRHRPARQDGRRPGRDHAACAARRRPRGSRSASTSSAASATRGVRAHRPGHRGEGGVGPRAGRPGAGAAARRAGDLDARRPRPSPTPTPRRRRLAVLRLHGPRPVARRRSARLHRRRPSSSRWRPTRASR